MTIPFLTSTFHVLTIGRNEPGKNGGDIQTQTNAVNTLLQMLGEQKNLPNNSTDMYTPQPFNQFNQQPFQPFPFNNFGQNQQFPFQQQFPQFNQPFTQQQQPFPFPQFNNNNNNNNQFPQFTPQQSQASPQSNAPVPPFMQPLANITQNVCSLFLSYPLTHI